MPSQIGQYTLTRTLGSGITSKVKLATDPSGNLWAVKVFSKNNPAVDASLLKALQAEVKTLQALHHANIVNMKEYQEDAEWHRSGNRVERVMYIVLEYISGGELFDFIAEGGPLPENICRFYFRQMLSALHYLH
jgi:serine/threonine protein kinase